MQLSVGLRGKHVLQKAEKAEKELIAKEKKDKCIKVKLSALREASKAAVASTQELPVGVGVSLDSTTTRSEITGSGVDADTEAKGIAAEGEPKKVSPEDAALTSKDNEKWIASKVQTHFQQTQV